MALIALGVTGGIGAYKAVEVARGLQKRGHEVAAVMTRSARRFVGEVTFEAITRRPRDHRPVRARRERRHRAHRARDRHRAAARRARDGEHHRQVRQRHRRRLPELAVSGDAGAGADGAGDEHATCSSTRPCAATGDACGARRAVRRSGRRDILACGWIGKGRLAEPDEIVDGGRPAPAPVAARCSAGSWSSPPGRPTKTSTPSATSATDRAGRWDTRSRPRRRGAARGSCSCPGRRTCSRRRASRSCRVRSAAEMHAAVQHACGRCRHRRHGRGRRRLHAGSRPCRRQDREGRRAAGAAPGAHAGHSRRARRCRAARPNARCSSASPPRAAIRCARGREKLRRKKVDFIVANDISRTTPDSSPTPTP